MKKAIKFKSIKDLRIKLGLTQTDVAMYLGIPRIQYIRLEQGSCTNVKTHVLSKLDQIHASFQKGINKPGNFPSLSINILSKRREKIRRYKISYMRNKLAEMEIEYERYYNLYVTLDNLKASNLDDQTWIYGQKQKALKKLHQSNEAKQEDLRERIYLLDSEEIFLSQYRQKTKNQIQTMEYYSFHNN